MTLSILWLGRTLPLPLNSGDRIYSARLAGAVARAGARITYMGLENPDEPGGDRSALDPAVDWRRVPGRPRSRIRCLFSALPVVGARFSTPQYKRALSGELMNRHDVIVLDQYGMSWVLDELQRRGRKAVLVHVAHDFESEVTAAIARNYSGNSLRKLMLIRNAKKTAAAEHALAHACPALVTLTDYDASAFARLNNAVQTIVLPPGYSGPKARARRLDASVPRRAVIVGSFGWIAKQMNLERFLEAASGPFARSAIELHVIGSIPESILSRLQMRFPGVTFRGFIDDLRQEFRSARLALVPEETGGGFKLKTLDYIFGRVPVAAVGWALNGIPSRLRSQFLVADDLSGLAARVVETIDDTERLNAMQSRAFDIAEGCFDWDLNGRRFVEAVQRIIARG